MSVRNVVSAIAVSVVFVQLSCFSAFAQEKKIPDGTDGIYYKEDSLTHEPKKDPNEVVARKSTFKIGFGYIHDFTAYKQNATFKRQMDSLGLDLKPISKPRDFRVLGSFRLRTKRDFAFKFGLLWNGDTRDWLVRETGFTIGVPELWGHIFIGRTKEGFSMLKVMNGHSPWGYERQMALDVIPILADGIKWFGFEPTTRIFWNVGYFNDFLSEGQSFSTFEWQYVARIGWMPFYDKKNSKLLHIASNLRFGKPLDGAMTLKSRPESNPTPQLINTDKFQTDRSNHMGGEIYYGNKSFTIGSEFLFHNFYSDESEDHTFFGGNVTLSYFLSGAIRPYNTIGSIYGFVPVRKSIFKGGWGEWEAVLTVSTLDLNSGTIQGGRLSRITPMVNWYLSKAIRMEFIYGYVMLDRFNLKGGSHFFESRIQFTVL
jgi:phosphate-selective porin OprO/OprP